MSVFTVNDLQQILIPFGLLDFFCFVLFFRTEAPCSILVILINILESAICSQIC